MIKYIHKKFLDFINNKFREVKNCDVCGSLLHPLIMPRDPCVECAELWK
jgi:hypothetical protein